MRLFDRFSAGVLMDPVSAAMGGVGLVTNLIGGAMKSSAANKAAAIQKQAADTAGQNIVNTTNEVNPTITAAADKASAGVTGAAGTAGAGATTAAQAAGAGVTGAAGSANDLLQPYIGAGQQTAGQLQQALQTGGALNHTLDASNFQTMDPGYNFRLQQAQGAMANKAAAGGGALGGNAALALSNNASNYASSEFQNAFARDQAQQAGLYGRLQGVSSMGLGAANTAGANTIGAARYAGDTGINAAQYGGNAGMAGAEFAGNAGMNAANTVGANTINATTQQGNYLTQGANATAAGKVGSANAWGDALSGIGGAAQSYGQMNMLKGLLKNPGGGGTSSGYFNGAGKWINAGGTGNGGEFDNVGG